MERKEKQYRELNVDARRAMFSILYVACKHGEIERDKKVTVAGQF
jgi:hypothetical protein